MAVWKRRGSASWLRMVSLLVVTLSAVSACETRSGSPASAPGPIAEDLPALVRAVPLILVGTVVDIRAGRAAGQGEARLQFNDVSVRVDGRLQGEAPPVVIVEQVDMTGRTVLSPDGGSSYRRGERYILFLSRGEGGRYITASQGRYLIDRGSVHSMGSGPVADTLNGATEAKVLDQIKRTARTAP